MKCCIQLSVLIIAVQLCGEVKCKPFVRKKHIFKTFHFGFIPLPPKHFSVVFEKFTPFGTYEFKHDIKKRQITQPDLPPVINEVLPLEDVPLKIPMTHLLENPEAKDVGKLPAEVLITSVVEPFEPGKQISFLLPVDSEVVITPAVKNVVPVVPAVKVPVESDIGINTEVIAPESKPILEITPEPNEIIVKPVEIIPKPVEIIPRPVEIIPKPVEIIPKPVEIIPKPIHIIPKPVEIIPKPIDIIPKPVEIIPPLEVKPDEPKVVLTTAIESTIKPKPPMQVEHSVPVAPLPPIDQKFPVISPVINSIPFSPFLYTNIKGIPFYTPAVNVIPFITPAAVPIPEAVVPPAPPPIIKEIVPVKEEKPLVVIEEIPPVVKEELPPVVKEEPPPNFFVKSSRFVLYVGSMMLQMLSRFVNGEINLNRVPVLPPLPGIQ